MGPSLKWEDLNTTAKGVFLCSTCKKIPCSIMGKSHIHMRIWCATCLCAHPHSVPEALQARGGSEHHQMQHTSTYLLKVAHPLKELSTSLRDDGEHVAPERRSRSSAPPCRTPHEGAGRNSGFSCPSASMQASVSYFCALHVVEFMYLLCIMGFEAHGTRMHT